MILTRQATPTTPANYGRNLCHSTNTAAPNALVSLSFCVLWTCQPRRPTALHVVCRQLGYCRYSPLRRPAGLASRGLSPAWVEAVAVVVDAAADAVSIGWRRRPAPSPISRLSPAGGNRLRLRPVHAKATRPSRPGCDSAVYVVSLAFRAKPRNLSRSLRGVTSTKAVSRVARRLTELGTRICDSSASLGMTLGRLE